MSIPPFSCTIVIAYNTFCWSIISPLAIICISILITWLAFSTFSSSPVTLKALSRDAIFTESALSSILTFSSKFPKRDAKSTSCGTSICLFIKYFLSFCISRNRLTGSYILYEIHFKFYIYCFIINLFIFNILVCQN